MYTRNAFPVNISIHNLVVIIANNRPIIVNIDSSNHQVMILMTSLYTISHPVSVHSWRYTHWYCCHSCHNDSNYDKIYKCMMTID